MAVFKLKNKLDPRYKFEIIIGAGAAQVMQLNPPGKPLAWNQCAWGQWLKSKTTLSRLDTLVDLLEHGDPSTMKFKRKVLWTYP